MSYNLKTLIVFDTNSLRSTEEGKVAYSFFAFGQPYQIVEEFIEENGLTENVHLAVPEWAVEELKDQKRKQYQLDVEEFQKLAKRLSGLPHTKEIIFPNDEFDCVKYVEEKASEFITNKGIELLELKKEMASDILQNMMTRVMREPLKKSPFSELKHGNKKHKDAGFKDNLVWESILNYERVQNYDKVILMSKDGDFNEHCLAEFKERWERHITKIGEPLNVVAELKKDYDNFIDNRKVFDFADKEYFKDYLNDILKNLSKIDVEGEELDIENYGVESYCTEVERTADEEGDFESPIIVSVVKIHVTKDRKKEVLDLIVHTTLADFETLAIDDSEFNPNVF